MLHSNVNMNDPFFERLIDRVFTKKEIQDEIEENTVSPLQFPNPFITIARDPGSGGAPIGREVSRRLGFRFYDQELLEEIARKTKLRKEILQAVDEKNRTGIQDFIHGLFNPDYVSDVTFLRQLAKVVVTLAYQGDAVILGRGANFMTPIDRGLHVRITAPLSVRIKRAIKYEQISVAQAKDVVSKVEHHRRDFVKQYFGHDPRHTDYYDIVINTQCFSVDDSVNLIITAFHKKFPGRFGPLTKLLK